MHSKNSIKKTFRLNPKNVDEDRILAYLELVEDKKEGMFIKEALSLYITLIDEGLYYCPHFYSSNIKQESITEKFASIVETLEAAQETQVGGKKIRVDSTDGSCEDLIINVNNDFDMITSNIPNLEVPNY